MGLDNLGRSCVIYWVYGINAWLPITCSTMLLLAESAGKTFSKHVGQLEAGDSRAFQLHFTYGNALAGTIGVDNVFHYLASPFIPM